MKLEKINNNKKDADVLGLNIIQQNGKFITKTFDKRRNFNFEIICFPGYFSNIPIQLGYNVYKAQIVRHAENNENIQNFKTNVDIISQLMSKRNYKVSDLRYLFRIICKKHRLHDKYNRNFQDLYKYMRHQLMTRL